MKKNTFLVSLVCSLSFNSFIFSDDPFLKMSKEERDSMPLHLRAVQGNSRQREQEMRRLSAPKHNDLRRITNDEIYLRALLFDRRSTETPDAAHSLALAYAIHMAENNPSMTPDEVSHLAKNISVAIQNIQSGKYEKDIDARTGKMVDRAIEAFIDAGVDALTGAPGSAGRGMVKLAAKSARDLVALGLVVAKRKLDAKEMEAATKLLGENGPELIRVAMDPNPNALRTYLNLKGFQKGHDNERISKTIQLLVSQLQPGMDPSRSLQALLTDPRNGHAVKNLRLDSLDARTNALTHATSTLANQLKKLNKNLGLMEDRLNARSDQLEKELQNIKDVLEAQSAAENAQQNFKISMDEIETSRQNAQGAIRTIFFLMGDKPEHKNAANFLSGMVEIIANLAFLGVDHSKGFVYVGNIIATIQGMQERPNLPSPFEELVVAQLSGIRDQLFKIIRTLDSNHVAIREALDSISAQISRLQRSQNKEFAKLNLRLDGTQSMLLGLHSIIVLESSKGFAQQRNDFEHEREDFHKLAVLKSSSASKSLEFEKTLSEKFFRLVNAKVPKDPKFTGAPYADLEAAENLVYKQLPATSPLNPDAKHLAAYALLQNDPLSLFNHFLSLQGQLDRQPERNNIVPHRNASITNSWLLTRLFQLHRPLIDAMAQVPSGTENLVLKEWEDNYSNLKELQHAIGELCQPLHSSGKFQEAERLLSTVLKYKQQVSNLKNISKQKAEEILKDLKGNLGQETDEIPPYVSPCTPTSDGKIDSGTADMEKEETQAWNEYFLKINKHGLQEQAKHPSSSIGQTFALTPAQLSSLSNLIPLAYKTAQQSGLGKIDVCYRPPGYCDTHFDKELNEIDKFYRTSVSSNAPAVASGADVRETPFDRDVPEKTEPRQDRDIRDTNDDRSLQGRPNVTFQDMKRSHMGKPCANFVATFTFFEGNRKQKVFDYYAISPTTILFEQESVKFEKGNLVPDKKHYVPHSTPSKVFNDEMRNGNLLKSLASQTSLRQPGQTSPAELEAAALEVTGKVKTFLAQSRHTTAQQLEEQLSKGVGELGMAQLAITGGKRNVSDFVYHALPHHWQNDYQLRMLLNELWDARTIQSLLALHGSEFFGPEGMDKLVSDQLQHADRLIEHIEEIFMLPTDYVFKRLIEAHPDKNAKELYDIWKVKREEAKKYTCKDVELNRYATALKNQIAELKHIAAPKDELPPRETYFEQSLDTAVDCSGIGKFIPLKWSLQSIKQSVPLLDQIKHIAGIKRLDACGFGPFVLFSQGKGKLERPTEQERSAALKELKAAVNDLTPLLQAEADRIISKEPLDFYEVPKHWKDFQEFPAKIADGTNGFDPFKSPSQTRPLERLGKGYIVRRLISHDGIGPCDEGKVREKLPFVEEQDGEKLRSLIPQSRIADHEMRTGDISFCYQAEWGPCQTSTYLYKKNHGDYSLVSDNCGLQEEHQGDYIKADVCWSNVVVTLKVFYQPQSGTNSLIGTIENSSGRWAPHGVTVQSFRKKKGNADIKEGKDESHEFEKLLTDGSVEYYNPTNRSSVYSNSDCNPFNDKPGVLNQERLPLFLKEFRTELVSEFKDPESTKNKPKFPPRPDLDALTKKNLALQHTATILRLMDGNKSGDVHKLAPSQKQSPAKQGVKIDIKKGFYFPLPPSNEQNIPEETPPENEEQMTRQAYLLRLALAQKKVQALEPIRRRLRIPFAFTDSALEFSFPEKADERAWDLRRMILDPKQFDWTRFTEVNPTWTAPGVIGEQDEAKSPPEHWFFVRLSPKLLEPPPVPPLPQPTKVATPLPRKRDRKAEMVRFRCARNAICIYDLPVENQ